IKPPEAAGILVPRLLRPPVCRLREHDRAVEGDLGPNKRARDALEERVLEHRTKQRVLLELLELPVRKTRTLPTAAMFQILVTTRRRVVLEEQALVDDPAEHEVVGATAKRVQGLGRQHGSEPRITVLREALERFPNVAMKSIGNEHRYLAYVASVPWN